MSDKLWYGIGQRLGQKDAKDWTLMIGKGIGSVVFSVVGGIVGWLTTIVVIISAGGTFDKDIPDWYGFLVFGIIIAGWVPWAIISMIVLFILRHRVKKLKRQEASVLQQNSAFRAAQMREPAPRAARFGTRVVDTK